MKLPIFFGHDVDRSNQQCPGKGQALNIPSITICHENPYKSIDKVGEMVNSGGYDDNTFDLIDLVTYNHTDYNVQPVSIVVQTSPK